jgi:hypothetical protein
MKNLVLGSAFNYTVDHVKPFVMSLRQHYDGLILFLINENTDKKTLDFYEEHEIYTYIPDENLTKATGNVKRFYHYLDCLDHFPDVENILLTDVRDVIFQLNPFANYPQYELEFFAEPEIFENCKQHNAPWYSNLYGADELEKISKEYVLCAGTTMGKTEKILDYIKTLINEIEILIKLNKAHGTCDQAAHNHIVYNKKFSNFRINHNGQGLVSTMHHSKLLKFNRQGYLLNDDNSVTPVVHQYDRCGYMSLVFLKNALQVKGSVGTKLVSEYASKFFPEHDLG